MTSVNCDKSVTQPNTGLGLTLVLGTDYEKKKQKERLREERNKEYNLFLQEKSQAGKLKRRTSLITLKSDTVNSSPRGAASSCLITPPHIERLASRRDAATLTEVADKRRSRKTWKLSPQKDRRWQIHMPKELHSSEETNTEEEEEDFRHRRRQNRYTPKPEHKEEKRSQECMNRKKMPESMRTAVTAELATGLMIGAVEDRTVIQMRKEQYKQQLLKQIAEQKENKMKEKKQELRVAVTGTTDSEKESDQIEPPGAACKRGDSLKRFQVDVEAVKDQNPRLKDENPYQNREQRAPRRMMDFSHLQRNTVSESDMAAVPVVPSPNCFLEDYHKDFTSLGEVSLPRFAGVAPPLPPIVPNTVKSPHDAVYFHYEARNPLDPDPQNQEASPGRVQQPGYFQIPPQQPLVFRANSPGKRGLPQQTVHHYVPSPSAMEGLGEDKSKSKSQLSYQEALKQQIKEREMLKKREQEEKEQLDAKLRAEMMAYNPWGRSGGGAPNRNQNGNLISDLNQMHRINNINMLSPEVTTGVPFSNQPSCGDDQSLPRLLAQDRYKEALKQQIEENNRKQAEERERIRINEENEEKRLAKERARIKQEYEKEQMKQKMRQMQAQICKPITDLKVKVESPQQNEKTDVKVKVESPQQNQKTDLKVKVESPQQNERTDLKVKVESPQQNEKTDLKVKVESPQQNEKTLPQSAEATGEKSSQLFYERAPSPPIPTLQKKQAQPAARAPSPPIPTLQKKQAQPAAVSPLSSRTERSVSAPHIQPLTPRLPPLNEGQQEVLRKLSSLRRFLRGKQKQLELQRGLEDPGKTHPSPPNSRRPRVDARKSAKEAVQPSARSVYPATAHSGKQNIKDFNLLKYRGANCDDEREERRCQQEAPQSAGEHREGAASRRRLTYEKDLSGELDAPFSAHFHGDRRQRALAEAQSIRYCKILRREAKKQDGDSTHDATPCHVQ